MLALEKLINLVDSIDVWDVTDIVVVPREVDVELIVVVIPQQLEHTVVQNVLSHHLLDHESMYELIHFFDRDVHSVVHGDTSF